MEMSNKELVFNTLKTYGCSTSKQVANLIHRNFNVSLTPSQVSGSIRSLIKTGVAANSKDGYGRSYYWLNDSCCWNNEFVLDALCGTWRLKK